ncbi:hypothetical protein MCHI_002004 [Candidatus Magnetoovum chiemensis]|nr:hypothetical protein MCHI_002004 [Candidatus Magnetoovum chiemensis]
MCLSQQVFERHFYAVRTFRSLFLFLPAHFSGIFQRILLLYLLGAVE